MRIQNIKFSGTETPQVAQGGVNTKKPIAVDKEKSNAAKYMIGAAALATFVAVGIIGHKNNWWRKAAEGTDLVRNIYGTDGKLISKQEYDPKTKKILRKIYYHDDSKTIQFITEHDPQTGNAARRTSYQNDGKTIQIITEHDPQTGNAVKSTFYHDDGKTIKVVIESDPQTGNKLREIYNHEGSNAIMAIIEYDSQSGMKIKTTLFDEDGSIIAPITN